MGVGDRGSDTHLCWVLTGSALFETQSQGSLMVWPFLITTSVSLGFINKSQRMHSRYIMSWQENWGVLARMEALLIRMSRALGLVEQD